MAESLLEVTPLYAGEGVRSIHRVIPAAQAVAALVSPRLACEPRAP
jgi:hypothetical protein